MSSEQLDIYKLLLAEGARAGQMEVDARTMSHAWFLAQQGKPVPPDMIALIAQRYLTGYGDMLKASTQQRPPDPLHEHFAYLEQQYQQLQAQQSPQRFLPSADTPEAEQLRRLQQLAELQSQAALPQPQPVMPAIPPTIHTVEASAQTVMGRTQLPSTARHVAAHPVQSEEEALEEQIAAAQSWVRRAASIVIPLVLIYFFGGQLWQWAAGKVKPADSAPEEVQPSPSESPAPETPAPEPAPVEPAPPAPNTPIDVPAPPPPPQADPMANSLIDRLEGGLL